MINKKNITGASKQDKMVGIFILAAAAYLVYGTIKTKQEEKNRIAESNRMKAEVDYLADYFRQHNPDVVGIGIEGNWNKGTDEYISIILQPGMDHTATYAMFPNGTWKGFKVIIR